MKPLFRLSHRLIALAFYAFIAAMAYIYCNAAIVIAAPVNYQRSSLRATFTQMNVPIEGRFKKFSGNIRFNPAQLAASSAHIEVDTASFDLNDEGFNREAHGENWLDVEHYPKATFKSSSIVAVGNDQYSISGKLTIHGKTVDVIVPVTIKQQHNEQHNEQVLEGVLPIKRLAFDIGQNEWKDTSVVDDRVMIKFHFVVHK